MILRPAQPNDLPVCARIMVENPLWIRYGIQYESALARLSTGMQNKADIIVAEETAEILGFIWFIPRGAFQRSGYILLIGVAVTQQGKKVGSALMDFAEASMSHTAADVILLVSGFNESAQRFYKKRGYEMIGILPNYVKFGIDEHIYRKILNA
jgi:ribosomal protein S18 acetylase RimI-like enzyme